MRFPYQAAAFLALSILGSFILGSALGKAVQAKDIKAPTGEVPALAGASGVGGGAGRGGMDPEMRAWISRNRAEILDLLGLSHLVAPADLAVAPPVFAPAPRMAAPEAPRKPDTDQLRLALAEPDAIHSSQPEGGGPALVYFFDYACIFCQRMVETVSALSAGNPDFSYQLRPVAILGEASLRAAQATEAARLQGRGFDYYKALMGLLIDYGGVPRDKALTEAAIGAALDIGRWETDRVSAGVAGRIERDRELAFSLGWPGGTPYAVAADATPLHGYMPAEEYGLDLRGASEPRAPR